MRLVRRAALLVLLAVLCAGCSRRARWAEENEKVARLIGEGHYQEALVIARENHRLANRIFSPGDKRLSIAAHNLALCHQELGHYQAAIIFFEEALAAGADSGGSEDTPGNIKTFVELGETRMYLGDNEKAVDYLMRALALAEKDEANRGDELSLALNNLAMAHRRMGNLAKAENFYKRSLAIAIVAHGPDSLDVGIVENNLGVLLLGDRSRLGEALAHFEKAREIRERELPPDHPDLATVMNNMATLYIYQDKYDKALPLFEECKRIWEKTYGHDHPRVATAVSNLGFLYQQAGMYEEAEKKYREALAIKEKVYGPRHAKVAEALEALAELYLDMGDRANAGEYKARAARIVSGEDL